MFHKFRQVLLIKYQNDPRIQLCFQGSLSNYIVLPQEYVKLKPKSLSFEVAATIPYTLMTAFDVLVTLGKIRPQKSGNQGLKLLICGGLRPTELMTLQLAK